MIKLYIRLKFLLAVEVISLSIILDLDFKKRAAAHACSTTLLHALPPPLTQGALRFIRYSGTARSKSPSRYLIA